MHIERDEFLAFAEVRKGGEYNMFDPRARELAGLSKEKWFEIIKQYNQLYNKHKGEIDDKE
jgi:hypothetical protein